MANFCRKVISFIITIFMMWSLLPFHDVYAAAPKVKITKLSPNETVQISGPSEVGVSANDAYADETYSYVIYNPTETQYQGQAYSNTYKLDDKSYIVIQNTSKHSMSIYTSATVKKINEPAVKHVTLKKGKNWEYVGGSDFYISGEHDRAFYMKDGSAANYNTSVEQKYNPEIEYDASRVVITAIKTDLDVMGPYRTFKVPATTKKPALYRKTIPAGGTFHFKTLGTTFSAPDELSYTWYDSVGTILTQATVPGQIGFVVKDSELSITTKRKQELYGPYELFYGQGQRVSIPKTNMTQLLFFSHLAYSMMDKFPKHQKIGSLPFDIDESNPDPKAVFLKDFREKGWKKIQAKGYYPKMSISKFIENQNLGEWEIYDYLDGKTGKDAEKAGFFGVIFKHKDNVTKQEEYVVSFRGTTGDPMTVAEDLANVILSVHSFQLPYAQKLMGKLPKGANVTVTGHSLGGYIASYMTLTKGMPGVTFNAPGFNAQNFYEVSKSPFKGLLVHHTMDIDVIGNSFMKFGTQYKYEKKDASKAKSVFDWHGINNFYQYASR